MQQEVVIYNDLCDLQFKLFREETWSGFGFTCKEVANTVQIVIKPTKTGLDKDIATMGQFIADETGTTTRSLARILKEFRWWSEETRSTGSFVVGWPWEYRRWRISWCWSWWF
jgi:hypothetical protein